jgi:CBS domain-containing protein
MLRRALPPRRANHDICATTMSDALTYLVKARPEAMGAYFKFLKGAGTHLDPKTRNLISVITNAHAQTENGLVGILTSADFMSAMNLDAGIISGALETLVRKGMGTVVDDIMTREPITIRADGTLEHAIRRMDKNKIKRLVVTDGQHQVRGIVSRSDAVKLFAAK